MVRYYQQTRTLLIEEDSCLMMQFVYVYSLVTGRANQGGQIVLYDDTMHFPQHQGGSNAKDAISKNSYEHDSSLSSITSATAGHLHNGGSKTSANRQMFSPYADYDVPPSKSANSLMMNSNEGGSSSGHQSAGSSSDLDKRSGQSVSTNDSGVGVVLSEPVPAQQQRNRPLGYQSQRYVSTSLSSL